MKSILLYLKLQNCNKKQSKVIFISQKKRKEEDLYLPWIRTINSKIQLLIIIFNKAIEYLSIQMKHNWITC